MTDNPFDCEDTIVEFPNFNKVDDFDDWDPIVEVIYGD
jgi:hypothetical protein